MKVCYKCKINLVLIYQTKYLDIYECPTCKNQMTFSIDDCCRDPFKIVIIDRTKKIDRLLYQCKNCGGIVNKNLPLSFKKYGDEIRDELNVHKYNDWELDKENDYLSIKEDIQTNNFWNSKRGRYIQYLNSDEWKKIRSLVLKRDENKCQKCKIKDAEEVHHKTYDNLYNENLEDLISVCQKCHKEIHELEEK